MSTYTRIDPVLVRPPTMNINHADTLLSRGDPIKQLFKNLFEILPAGARGHAVAVIGEFIGTLLFIFLAFSGVEVASASSNKDQGSGVSTATAEKSPQQLLYIALSAGFALVVTAWTFFRISGGLFNPAISLGMALIGAISWFRCLLLCIAQTVATIVASYMVYALFNGGLNVGVGLGGGTSNAQGVIIEMLLTAQLAFTIFMLAAEQHEATHLAPVGIGLSLFIAELIGVFWTGGAVNPARALAPCIVNRDFPTYHWIYWVGPIAGVLLAVVFYKLVKAMEYETAQSQDDYMESHPILPRAASRKPSSVVPLASIRSDSDHPEEGATHLQPIKTPLRTPAPTAVVEKKQESALPECYAD
ncbi:aquaporin-like protein [Mollisia scopiformis]|uniref:Aquaporin-like protein n=1 Tax=Mollisia scopiformis TaxID=149040 RepID=A0A194XB33_MOLSC|nr:aquaporin-like protein [Mollisia scopiformis]KUJ17354.1 aquaporin-like protein [Mollisia scopiformis]